MVVGAACVVGGVAGGVGVGVWAVVLPGAVAVVAWSAASAPGTTRCRNARFGSLKKLDRKF